MSKKNNKSYILIKLISYVTIMFYMILSTINLIQVFSNLGMLISNGSVINIVFNCLLYVMVILSGLNAILGSKKESNIVLSLLAIIIIY